jgi:sec-independent protein translocase protein TatA
MNEWIIVAVIGIVVIFGASKLPEIARNLGRSSGEFKKGLKEGDEPKSASTTDAATTTPPPTESSRDQARTDPTA